MNNALRLLALSLLLGSVAFCQTAQETTKLQHQRFETNLAGGTSLRLHLHEGDFRVVGSDAEKISIHVDGKNVEQAKKIKIQVTRSDGAVDLKLSHVPKNELQVTIEIDKSVRADAGWRPLGGGRGGRQGSRTYRRRFDHPGGKPRRLRPRRSLCKV